MIKNNSAVETSPPQHHPKKACLTSILPTSPPKGQSQSYKRLTQAVRRRELTTSLEILSESQIEGDLAIFVIANLQQMEVGA